MKLSFWSIGIICAAIGPLGAVPITINNASFENPALGCAAGPSCFGAPGVVTNWTVNPAGGTAVVFKPDTTSITTVPGPTQVLADVGADVWQDTLSPIAIGTTYTLTVNVGRRLETAVPFSAYTVELSAGGIVLVSDSALTPSAGGFLLDTLTYTAKAGDTGTLRVDLIATGLSVTGLGNAQTDFDNVALDGTVQTLPEPSAMILGGLGLIPMFFLRRRRS